MNGGVVNLLLNGNINPTSGAARLEELSFWMGYWKFWAVYGSGLWLIL